MRYPNRLWRIDTPTAIKVHQQISQANVCTGVNEEAGESPTLAEKESAEPAPARTVCVNSANNSADVQH